MYVQQADFFFGTSMTFANEVMKTAIRESHPAGTILFEEGEAADRLYVLLEGRVRISLGESGHVVYIVSRGGEAFGPPLWRATAALCSKPRLASGPSEANEQ